MSRKMTVVFHNEELYTYLKVEAARRHMPASEIIADAVSEWLESREDAELLPTIEAARTEWKEKGGRPWSEAEREIEESVQSRHFDVPKSRIVEFCSKHHIKKLSLFGSVLRDDFQPESDIDVMVEFEPGHVPGFAIIDMENELSKLAGRKVDLRTPKELSRYFRDRVIREAKVEYAETQS